MSDIGDDIDGVDDPGPQDSDPSPADPGPNGPAGKDSILGPQDASNLAGFDKLPSDIFRTDGGSCYGFPELTDPSNASPFNADADLTNKKELAEGAFKLLTGEEPTASGVYHLITQKPSAKEVAIGLGVGLGALLFGRREAAAATEGAELVLGTDALAGVRAAVQQLKSAAEAGTLASEAAGLYESVKTRLEGFVQFDDAARSLSKSRAPDDHTPGETRAKQNRVEP